MPRTPKPKSTQSGIGYLLGGIGSYNAPNSLDGNLWRNLARTQPVVMNCITTLVMRTQSLDWDIRAKDPDKQDELQDSIDYHKDIIINANGKGYLNHISYLLDDFYMIPFGGASETLRYSDGKLYDILNIDGSTLYPTYDKNFPVIQQYNTNLVTFAKDEIVRMYQSPRTEIERFGWGMSPVEKIYLAIDLLSKGDKYYAGLLLDTPEAGLLDLGDMSRESAEKWLDSFRSLMGGIDGFKIPVLFEHTVPAKFIPFGRPPTDMLFDQITLKYAQLVCGAFGLTLGDIGIKSGNGGLSSDIRDERHSKSTGFASVKSYLVYYFNNILPNDLLFAFIDADDELLVSKGRARSANAVAMRNWVESGILTPKEARQQAKADGLISIPLSEEVNPEDFDIVKEISGLSDQLDLQEEQLDLQKEQVKATRANGKLGSNKIGGQGGTGLNKQRNLRGGKLQVVQGKEPVPASQGGQGEIKSVYKSKISDYFSKEFDKVKSKLNKTRSRKLAKQAINTLATKSIIEIDDYLECLFDNKENDETNLLIADSLTVLEKSISGDKFWYIDLDETSLGDILIEYYIDGLIESGNEIQNILYEEGLTNELEIKYSPNISDKKSKELYDYALSLLNMINNGSDYYIQRISIASVLETLKEPYFQASEDVYKSDDFVNAVSDKIINNIIAILNNRSEVISEYEIDKTIQRGRLDQYKYKGFTEKILIHIGSDIPCEHCQSQEALGYVPIDFEFLTKMGDTTQFGLLHPRCHHLLKFKSTDLNKLNQKYLYE